MLHTGGRTADRYATRAIGLRRMIMPPNEKSSSCNYPNDGEPAYQQQVSYSA
jgi:hypothetical protein